MIRDMPEFIEDEPTFVNFTISGIADPGAVESITSQALEAGLTVFGNGVTLDPDIEYPNPHIVDTADLVRAAVPLGFNEGTAISTMRSLANCFIAHKMRPVLDTLNIGAGTRAQLARDAAKPFPVRFTEYPAHMSQLWMPGEIGGLVVPSLAHYVKMLDGAIASEQTRGHGEEQTLSLYAATKFGKKALSFCRSFVDQPQYRQDEA